MKIRHHVVRFSAINHAGEGVYGVSIFQADPAMAVVVLTEIDGNPGLSVTNAVEHVARKVRRAFLTSVAADQIIWVERYKRNASLADSGETEETFDLVRLDSDPEGNYSSPSWFSIGGRDSASFWKILFQSDKPLDEFPAFDQIATRTA